MLAAAVGLFLSFYCGIALFAIFILFILIKSKKVGFQKAVKSKTALAMIVFIVLCGLANLFFGWTPPQRSGYEMFQDLILKTVPKSVEFLDQYDGRTNYDPDYCLHFKIAPADFQQILALKNWKTVAEAPYVGLQCELGKSAWNFNFPPPALGNSAITYTFIPRERDIEFLFTNLQMNEVYYFYHDGNLP